MSDPSNYVVGWICALMTEYVAAQELLDEEHDGPAFVSSNDTNDYTLGKMGQHHVVIAALPYGEYGTASAANVATNLLNSFPNVRIGLMVGIGGGRPSKKHDFRLGDIVAMQGQGLQITRFLNQPPTILRTAITGIQAQYERKGHQIKNTIQDIIENNPRLRRKYQRPAPSTDRLFQPEVIHTYEDCTMCADGPSNLILRVQRASDEDDPAIHYGLIASGNMLVKDALIRDRLAAEKDILCFETEAAGLMNSFPCLVIRGICDYSDSHAPENEEWQGYAAMVAAAYTKDLLYRIPSNRVEAEKKIGDVLSDLKSTIHDHMEIAQKHLKLQQNSDIRRLTEKQEECLQLFRLTTGDTDTTYEWYKDRVGDRVEGTCNWFLNHANFQRWLEQESGPLLVSADPGCGKSVLARYLIDNILPRSSTICYFFFKDQDQNTVRQALCALLHQLFSQMPFLIQHAIEHFKTDGPTLIRSTIKLWTILEKALNDTQAGSVIIVLDALDECAESEFENLMQNLRWNSLQPDRGKTKFLLTSRPYEQIIDEFRSLLHSFPYIRIPGEEKSDEIGQEVSHVIQYRVERLAEEKGLPELVKNHLAKKLLQITHRTYLWVYLVFDYLKATNFKKTLRGVDSISAMPANVNEAYEQILNKSKEQDMARRALSILLAASRPLKISEMNIALNVDNTLKCIRDLDLEEKDDFKIRLKTVCGLFVSIHHDRIYFLHQTAREFLLADAVSPVSDTSGLLWQHSITSQSAHDVLAGICVIYLDCWNEDDISRELGSESKEEDRQVDSRAFLYYAASNWGMHARTACINAGSDLIARILRICSPVSKIFSIWGAIYWYDSKQASAPGFNGLLISSYFGIEAVVKLQLEKGAKIECQDTLFDQTPLSWAARSGHESILKLLLENGAMVDSKDDCGQTPLCWAARNGHDSIVKLLLDNGAIFDFEDPSDHTPLCWAAENGHESIVKLLLEKGAKSHSEDNLARTPLFWAITSGHKSIVKLLLDNGAIFDFKDGFGQTPLSLATEYGHETIVHLLLDKGATFNLEEE
ncbi:hypothetical protein N7466_006470 [Penicillium verhagenii]|uniref:uncharacterized protein n=1 Tax=Penicillium verhagenii TaxID=1562060 RepID=UPI0025451082|nr:uncharacterized protein N7466_006470 [Penicillium verhagenii]KAJ5930977.1 hypothetical protein N7466_006470 [Penicillium verhagenii]